METEAHQDAYPRRLEWIAVVLVVINLIMMMYSYALYSQDRGWGQTVVALHTATAIILLTSVIFSVFGLTPLSRIALGTGILTFMIAIVALGIKLMDMISDGGYYY